MDRFEIKLEGAGPNLENAARAVEKTYPRMAEAPAGWNQPTAPGVLWLYVYADDRDDVFSNVGKILWDFQGVHLSEVSMVAG